MSGWIDAQFEEVDHEPVESNQLHRDEEESQCPDLFESASVTEDAFMVHCVGKQEDLEYGDDVGGGHVQVIASSVRIVIIVTCNRHEDTDCTLDSENCFSLLDFKGA